MARKFSNLHGHSGHSVYDAIGSPKDYAEWLLKNDGGGAFAITDHGSMNAIGPMVAAQKEYDKKGVPIKFVYGCEMYFTPSLSEWHTLKNKRDEERKEEKKTCGKQEDSDSTELVIENEKDSKSKYFDPLTRRNHLVLVAQNQEGLKNLFRLVSRSYREGFYKKPRIDMDMLRQFNAGIVASTACLAGIPTWCSLQAKDDAEAMALYDRELQPMMEIFGKDRFFLELQFNRIPEQQIANKHIIQYAKHSGYNLIATADCHYPDPQMFRDREIYRLLGYQMQKRDIDLSILEKQRDELECELYLKNGDQMFDAYKESFAEHCSDEKLITDAIERTYDIAHNFIEKVAPDDRIKLPKTFQVTEKIQSPFDKLKELVLTALKEKKLNTPEYINRAAFELKVIQKIKTEEYFLAMKQILDTLKQHMLIGPGRGSGAGSLVNYLLGITLLDPIKHGLLFERFLSPSRAELPDVDSDVESKDEAFEILKKHFGAESVLAISNYNRLTLKALIKDLSKLYSIPYTEVNAVTKVAEIEARPGILAECGNDQKLYDFTLEGAKKYSPTFNKFLQGYPHLADSVENLFKEVKAVSRHAGGVLVVPNAEECLPIIRIREVDQSPITEGITAQHLKYFGLVKFDVLGLGTLRIIRRCIETILKNNNEDPSIENVWKFYNAFLHPDIIDPNDKQVFAKVYNAGRFPSIFQFEKQRVQNFCTRATPWSVRDLSAITALWRPGPLCLSKNSTITVSSEGKRITIEQLYDKFHENDAIFRKKFPLQLVSLNENESCFVKSKILNVIKSGKKDVYKIFFQRDNRHDVEKITDSSFFNYQTFNNVLLSTLDHRFLTKNGWKKLSEIRRGEYICTERRQSFKKEDPKEITRKGGNVKGKKTFRSLAFKHYEYRCIFCDWNEGSLDVNHIEENRNKNNDYKNLSFLCPNHHRKYSEGNITKEELINRRKDYELTYNNDIQFVRFLGIEYVGEEETYDISVESPYHNFIAGGFVVHNSGGADEKYVHHNAEEASQDHPILVEKLGDTRGLLLYQEQFMLLASSLAGFSLEDADKLRKLLVKPATENKEEIEREREEIGKKFIVNCVERGLTQERATRLWKKEILGFISYGFNKSMHFQELVTVYNIKGEKITDKPISEIQKGEFLKSRNEETKEDIFVEVIDKYDHGMLELVEIELDNGSKVRCTMDHKFRVIDGRMLPLWEIMKENLDIVA